MIKAGIAGATGYTGIELVQLLHRHPQAVLQWITSVNSAGKPLSEVHAAPWNYPLITLEAAYARAAEVDVVFLCLPHGQSIEAARTFAAAGIAVIDLSADFRLPSVDAYRRWYGLEHTAPELLPSFVYGLCEVNREKLRTARLIAVPGCYPTTVNLGLYPLAKAGWLGDRVIIDSKSGVSGAGRTAKQPYMFVEANENMTPYAIGHRHRHIAEMELVLNGASPGGACRFTFSPHLLPASRGILSTMYVRAPAGVTETQIRDLYAATYAGEPFIHLLPAGQQATLRHTVHSNRCAISITADDPDDPSCRDFIIVATEDNLLKGASGQAVQCMNLAFGLDEIAGLI
ncbi:MAG: N-acetyl-gamma-glutamyl-phosphate reductase [Caldilineaceae bacterium]|jgi:N-acetyl-gamma-glutamyl-phosphate reductase|nr:N-acetyl-gamma-glutamyl-phosphate reductase [Caldilineaceae bacterium]